MKVLVDSAVWSLAFRRSNIPETREITIFRELVRDLRATTIAPIKQELLSGIKSEIQFDSLSEKLSWFPSIVLVDEDYIQAAKFFNICRKNGVQGSFVDFLICSVAYLRNIPIFSTDKDFIHYKKHLPIQLFEIR